MSSPMKPLKSYFFDRQDNTPITLRIKANDDGSVLEFREGLLGVNYKKFTNGREAHLRAGRIKP